MSLLADFMGEFDKDGGFKRGDGVLDVVFLTRAGRKYPGKLHFANGLCVRADIMGGRSWVHPDNSPLTQINILLQFDDEARAVMAIDQGLVVNCQNRNELRREAFLRNLRIARNLFVHRPPAKAVTSAIDTVVSPTSRVREAIWLTPKSVEDYASADFAELGPAGRTEVDNAIGKFEGIARAALSGEPMSEHQFSTARAAFETILDRLERHLSQPNDSKQVEDILSTIDLPEWVVNWNCELGSDADGGPAVWIDLFVNESDMPIDQIGRCLSELSARIRHALSASAIDRWPYVRLRSVADHMAVSR